MAKLTNSSGVALSHPPQKDLSCGQPLKYNALKLGHRCWIIAMSLSRIFVQPRRSSVCRPSCTSNSTSFEPNARQFCKMTASGPVTALFRLRNERFQNQPLTRNTGTERSCPQGLSPIARSQFGHGLRHCAIRHKSSPRAANGAKMVSLFHFLKRRNFPIGELVCLDRTHRPVLTSRRRFVNAPLHWGALAPLYRLGGQRARSYFSLLVPEDRSES